MLIDHLSMYLPYVDDFDCLVILTSTLFTQFLASVNRVLFNVSSTLDPQGVNFIRNCKKTSNTFKHRIHTIQDKRANPYMFRPVVCTGLWMPEANSMIWINVWGQLLDLGECPAQLIDLDECPGPTP